MKSAIAVSVLTVALAACNSVPMTKVLSGSERSVVVQAIDGNLQAAQSLADAECAKHSRKARLSQRISGVRYSYDCER